MRHLTARSSTSASGRLLPGSLTQMWALSVAMPKGAVKENWPAPSPGAESALEITELAECLDAVVAFVADPDVAVVVDVDRGGRKTSGAERSRRLEGAAR